MGVVVAGTAVISVFLGMFVVSDSEMVTAVIAGLIASLLSLIVVNVNKEDRRVHHPVVARCACPQGPGWIHDIWFRPRQSPGTGLGDL